MKTNRKLIEKEIGTIHKIGKKIWRWSQLLVLCWIVMGSLIAEAQPFAYVANVGSNTVSVIDVASNTVVATVTVGTSPSAVAITPDGAFAYVTNGNSDNVSVINTTSNTVVATVMLGTVPSAPSGPFGPKAVAITPDGAFAYVANIDSGTVSVINTTSNTVVDEVFVGIGLSSVAITPDGTLYVVANIIESTVSVIDTTTNDVVDTVTVGSAPLSVVIAGTSVYVTNAGEGTVSVIDTTTNTVVDTVTVGSTPLSVVVVGTSVYVTNADSGTISVIDTTTNTVAETIVIIPNLEVDIKPQACPNLFSVNSKGKLPVAILGTPDFDVKTIEVLSIKLNGVSPIRSAYADVTAPAFKIDSCDCQELDEDSFVDLALKFDRQEIVATLGEFQDGDTIPLTLRGNLLEGAGSTAIEGTDCVQIEIK